MGIEEKFSIQVKDLYPEIHCIVDLDGKFLSSFGRHGNGSGDFAQPNGVGVDSEGHIYVVDALFDCVQIFDTKGRFLIETIECLVRNWDLKTVRPHSRMLAHTGFMTIARLINKS